MEARYLVFVYLLSILLLLADRWSQRSQKEYGNGANFPSRPFFRALPS